MSYYLVVSVRKVNSLCFTTNVFLSNSYRTQGAALSAFTLSGVSARGILWKKVVLKNLAKFLRTPFLQNASEQLLLSFIETYVRYFLSNFCFSPKGSPSKTMKNVFFNSSKKLFSFSKYPNFCISVFPSFSSCQALL